MIGKAGEDIGEWEVGLLASEKQRAHAKEKARPESAQVLEKT
jgi:hypothetical protein